MKGIIENEKTKSEESNTNMIFGGTARISVHHGCAQKD